jgi:antirestriction protein ArdC
MKSPAYNTFMERLVAELDKGVLPWRKPWKNGSRPGLPTRNNGEAFTGANVLMLSMSAAANGFSSNRWFTYNQAAEVGGQVRRGEKGSVAILCNKTTRDDESGDPEKVRHLVFTKAYAVFCADQIDGLPDELCKPTNSRSDASAYEISEFIRCLALPVKHKGDMAYYHTGLDEIVMPHPDQFETLDKYQAVLLHEAGHLTGSKNRLDRKDLETYHLHPSRAREELTAELISLFLGYHVGLRVDDELITGHASYIHSWHNILKKDPEELVRAAARAQKACDWLIARADADVDQVAA